MTSSPQTGVWTHPTGPRFEVTHQADGWHIAVYQRPDDQRPGARYVFDTADAAAEQVGVLTGKGYVHQPGLAATPPAGRDTLWTPGHLVGAVLLALAVVGFGMWILGY
ncbi:hypothetical protein [Micromonospora carbonacea]|uniref:WGR domain-containing protein n=1 Tax=Micromonospora carbonacea TaxID=47853 RepID=A0A1C4WZC1_9ACTN|nr:hypothetical protein [Micromonospora carbonacea]SCF01536.1 hypothetical protein GA0070563_104127 [Micromonospora carbonacea]